MNKPLFLNKIMCFKTNIKSYIRPFALLPLLLWLLLVKQTMAADVIGPDDVVRISVYGYEDLQTETRVSAAGRITFPLVGEVDAAGKTSMELEKSIAERLSQKGFIQEAQVNVTVLERVSQQISVLGYVHKPGRYSLNSDSTILDLIAMAGGVTEMGDMKAVLTRNVDGKPDTMLLDLRVYLEDAKHIFPFKIKQGDVLYVPKAAMFYIYGEVQRPGSYRLEENTTVVKALSLAGGLTLRGTEDDVVIKRKNDKGKLNEIDAELSDVVAQEDVIYVNERWF
jgi:polysaccharide biosynthesis/export protein